jgi:hypothetical protein
MKEIYDRGLQPRQFSEGDLLILYDNTVGTKAKESGKFAVQWPGSYLVLGHAGGHGNCYHLHHIHGREIPGSHHGDHLKLYQRRTGHLAQLFDGERMVVLKAIR